MRFASASVIGLLTACTAKPDSAPVAEQAEAIPGPAPKPAPEPAPKPAPEPVPIPQKPSFEARFGGIWVDIGKDVALAPDGGYVLVGRSQRVDDRYSDDYQLAVVVLDPLGEQRWSKYLGPEANYQAGAGVAVDQGGLTVAGTTNGEGAGKDDAWVVRLDWQGETVWTRTLGTDADEFARAIAFAPAGGWLVVGGTKRDDGLDAMAWRIGANGDVFFTKELGSGRNDVGLGLVQWADGWVVVGRADHDGWIVALDSRGEPKWERTHGGPKGDELCALTPTDTGWLAVGESASRTWAVWLDPEGLLLDQKTFVPGVLLDVAAQPSGWVVGGIRDEGLPEAWLGWIGPDHAQVRERGFEPNRNALEALVPTPDGGLLLTGNWGSINSNYGNIWACKLDAAGEGC